MMANIEVVFVIEGCYDYGNTDVWRDWRLAWWWCVGKQGSSKCICCLLCMNENAELKQKMLACFMSQASLVVFCWCLFINNWCWNTSYCFGVVCSVGVGLCGCKEAVRRELVVFDIKLAWCDCAEMDTSGSGLGMGMNCDEVFYVSRKFVSS